MPGTINVIKGLTTLAREGTHEGTRAFKELAEWVAKQQFKREAPEVATEIASFKKDPAQVFLAARHSGPRVPTAKAVKAPEGFEFPKRIELKRSPLMKFHANVERKLYSQFEKPRDPRFKNPDIAKSQEIAPTATSLQELQDVAKQTIRATSHVQKPLLPRASRNLGGSYKYDPSLRRAVERDAKEGLTHKQLVAKYPNVNRNTITSWSKGG